MTEKKCDWHRVVAVSDLAEGEMFGVEIHEIRLAIYNVDGTFLATSNVCSHAFALLTDGWLDGGVVECPLHGGRFDVASGKALGDPVDCDI